MPWSSRVYLTSKFTALPATIFCPAAGVWLTIMLAAFGVDGGLGGGEAGVCPFADDPPAIDVGCC